MHSRIAGTGSYLPAQVLTNEGLAQRIDTSDAWIRARTAYASGASRRRGTDERPRRARVARGARCGRHRSRGCRSHRRGDDDSGHGVSVHGLRAAGEARRPRRTGIRRAGGVQRVRLRALDRRPDGRRRLARNALVVGAEIYSRILDWNDRGTCVLFGDGAGAVVLVPSEVPGHPSAHLHADGAYRDILCVPGTIENGEITGSPFVRMDGHIVFKFAVNVMTQVANEALAANGVDASASIGSFRIRRTSGSSMRWRRSSKSRPSGSSRLSIGTPTRRPHRSRSRSTKRFATAASAPATACC
jgi:3-oxoacyl-[acyl-carrier-protein] synthase-3